MKNIFNKAVQYGEDVYYGMMFESMGAQRKLRLNLIGGFCVAVGGYGLLAGDVTPIALSTLMLTATAATFGDAGAAIRKNAAMPQPKF